MQERRVVLYKGYGKPTVPIPTETIRPFRIGGKAVLVPFMLGGDPSGRVRFHPRPNPSDRQRRQPRSNVSDAG